MDWESAAKLMASGVAAIDKILSAIGHDPDGDPSIASRDALTQITQVVQTLNGGDIKEIDPEEVRSELELMLTLLGDNDTAVDVAVDEKFDKA